MSQAETVGDLERSVGYALKQAAAALRASMDAALRPMALTVPQYACLELLGQRPGLSGAELARAAFVTRQSMNEVLRGLHERGLLDRPAAGRNGRSLRTDLTPAGRRQLVEASSAVRAVERRMLQDLSPAARTRLRLDLVICSTAISADVPVSPGPGE